MIRWRGRVWLDHTMHYDNRAAEMMCEQAAFDFGFRDTVATTAFNWRDDYRAEFMLWTGYLDTVSVEVYEGDVCYLNWIQAYAVVRWRKDQCDYVFTRWQGVNRFDFLFHPEKRFEVVGNICQHPDFMQKVRVGALDELPADLAALRLQSK